VPAFTGFPPDALAFYRELEADNSKVFWQANRQRYEDHIRTPMELLLDALFDEFGEAKVFRPYRDVRFSKDKTPYKTQIAATVGGHYVALGAGGLYAGGGRYHLDRDQLARWRRAVQEPVHAGRLGELAAELDAAGMPLRGETLKTAPRGVPADHPHIHWLRMKSAYALRAWEPAPPWVHSAEAVEHLAAAWRATRPLCHWLDAVVAG
jgi:uncharacterized protein (TIGR02453 family)